jgi:nucleotide-binding universal stress UspA family protein
VSKIIVGIDESDRSRDAVALAAQLARGTEAELGLVCAFPYPDVPTKGLAPSYRRYLREDAEAAIERAQEGVVDLPPVTRYAITDLSPAKAIQSVAVSEDASLIVIGSSHRSSIGRVLAGTTAERLLHGSPCAVAVAPNGFAIRGALVVETIGVAYDRSPESKAALTAATALARSLDARLRIIEVLDMLWIGTPALMSGPGYIMPPEELEKRARQHLAGVMAGLPDDVVAEQLVKVGDPEGELAAQTELVDLMIVGSRGYGPHRAVLLGSVSGRLVRDAACPVVVVPRGVEAPLEQVVGAASGSRAL